MQAGAGVQAGSFLEELAAAMCRAQGPFQALLVAAGELNQQLPSLAYVGLAVGAQDRQSVGYSTLRSAKQGAARLGAVAASSCAAGIAIDTKQVVHVRDLVNGDLGLLDLQYLQQEHEARACFLVPLVVANSSLGALSLAATQSDAFNGHESWLQMVAAMCSPYVLLLKSHEGLLALEGLVSQVLPMRVALQLQDQQRIRSSLQLPPEAAQQQQLPVSGTGPATGPAGLSTAAAGAPGAGAQLAAAGLQAGASNEPVPGDASVAGSSLRQLRARLRQQQRPGTEQQQAQTARPAQQQQQPQPAQQQQQQQRMVEWASGYAGSLAFQQPRLEQAYQRWALQQWLRLFDTMFLLLVLLSAFGTHLQQALSVLAWLQQPQHMLQPWRGLQLQDISVCTALAAVLALTVAWVLYSLRGQSPTACLNRRKPAVAAVRLLRTLVFCCEVWHMKGGSGSALRGPDSPHVGSAQQGAAASPVRLSSSTSASCGLLMMLGLLGQLPTPLHGAVQAACLTAVSITLLAASAPMVALRAGSGIVANVLGAASGFGWLDVGYLVVLGWVLPVLLVAAVEWGSRHHFLRKIS